MRFLIVTAALLTCQFAFAEEKQPAITRLGHVTVFVKDYDEALKWYTQTLGLEKTADQPFGDSGERWLTVAPAGQKETQIVLAKTRPSTAGLIGKQSHWVFQTSDCQKAYQQLQARGVKFSVPPQKQPWGTQAIFEDLYGNQFVLVEDR